MLKFSSVILCSSRRLNTTAKMCTPWDVAVTHHASISGGRYCGTSAGVGVCPVGLVPTIVLSVSAILCIR